MTIQTRDIFICHASEDKDEVVRPMVEAFNQAGVSCWYDEAEIKWGDSITQKVNAGLRISRYVIVVLSPTFLAKNWPQRELNSALNLESTSGEVKVLPLLVGTEIVVG
ncbi:MAG: toll/interleukin-1 receptor domain-containing protein [Deltaproteobacteria bacterium]|nr:toll/interleukin-1 receptor domain-containing protein [Deltaproteobacteria bacterium]